MFGICSLPRLELLTWDSVPERPTKDRKVSKSVKRCQKVSKKVSKSVKKCQKVSKSVKRKCWKTPKSVKKCQKVSKSVKKCQKVSKSVKKRQKVSKSVKVSKSIKKCQKVSKSVKKFRKVSKTVKNGQKVSKRDVTSESDWLMGYFALGWQSDTEDVSEASHYFGRGGLEALWLWSRFNFRRAKEFISKFWYSILLLDWRKVGGRVRWLLCLRYISDWHSHSGMSKHKVDSGHISTLLFLFSSHRPLVSRKSKQFVRKIKRIQLLSPGHHFPLLFVDFRWLLTPQWEGGGFDLGVSPPHTHTDG